MRHYRSRMAAKALGELELEARQEGYKASTDHLTGHYVSLLLLLPCLCVRLLSELMTVKWQQEIRE